MADKTSPQETLAEALNGFVTGPSTIRVGTRTIVAYPTGSLYVLPERRRIGSWSDPTDQIVAAFRQIVGVKA